jgi:Zn-dependent M28 family amino/carboxypeptidase
VGSRPETGEILLGAHYDTVAGTRGADDNATGVAVLLAAARRFSKSERSLRLVFFDGEERGLLGSKAYVSDPARLDRLVAAVVVEMVGFSCRTPGCQRSPPGVPAGLVPSTGHFLGVVGDFEHLDLLSTFRRAGGAGRPEVRVLPVPAKGRTMPDTRRSDHAPFWDAGVGAVMVTDTANLRSAHYHQPTDTPETLDPEFLRGSAAVILDAVAALLRAPTVPAPPASAATRRPAGRPTPPAAPRAPPHSTR